MHLHSDILRRKYGDINSESIIKICEPALLPPLSVSRNCNLTAETRTSHGGAAKIVHSSRKTHLEFACYRTSGFKDVRDEHTLGRLSIVAQRAPSAVSLLSLLTQKEREGGERERERVIARVGGRERKRERGRFVSFYMVFR